VKASGPFPLKGNGDLMKQAGSTEKQHLSARGKSDEDGGVDPFRWWRYGKFASDRGNKRAAKGWNVRGEKNRGSYGRREGAEGAHSKSECC